MPTIPRAEYEITSKDTTREGLLSASKNLSSFGTSLSSTFKGIATGAAAVAGTLTAIGLGINKLTDIYGKQEKAEIRLTAAAKNNPYFKSKNVDNLFSYASSLQSISEYGDEAILSMMSLGVAMGRTEEEIKNISLAAINYAAGTGQALETAFKQIYKTFGGFAGEMGENLPAIKALTVEQLKAGQAVGVLMRQYDGLAQSVASSTLGIKEQAKNAFGDMFENIGKGLAPLQNIVSRALIPIFNSIGQWFTENGAKITNFFLHFGEIARLTFVYIKKSFTAAFEWENVASMFSAFWEFIKKRAIAAVQFLWQIFTSIGTTIWTPLKAGFEWTVYGIKMVWANMINALATGINWFVENPINAVAVAFKKVVNFIGESIEFVLNGLLSMINVLIDGLNTILKSAFEAGQAIKHPFDPGKRESFKGGVDKIPSMKIDWLDPKKHEKLTTNLTQFTADLKDIPKPDASFQKIYETIRDSWVDTLGEGKDYMTGLFSDIGELGGILAEPFKIGFAGFTDEFVSILERDLPPEAQSVVNKLKEALDIKPTKDVTWKAFMAYLKGITDKLKTSFGNFISSFKAGIVGIKDGINKSVDFIKQGFKDPKEAIARAGFGLIAALEKTKDGIKKEASGNLFAGLTGAAGKLFSFISDGIKNTSGWSSIMDWLKTNLNSIFELFVSPLIIAIQPLLDAFLKVVNVLLTAAAPAIEAFGMIFSSLEPVFKALEPVVQQIGLMMQALAPIIQSLVSALAQILVPILGIFANLLSMVTDLLTSIQPVLEILFQTIATILTPIIQFLANILQTLAPLFDLIAQILIAVAPIIQAIGELLTNVLGPVLTFLADLISGILTPILQVFTGIMQVLTPIFNIFSIIIRALTPIFNVLLNLLNILLLPLQIFGVIMEALNPIFELLASIIVFITPVFELLAKVIDAATRPIEFIGDLFSWLGQGLKALGQTIWYLITFQWRKMGDIEWPGAFRSDAFTRPLIDTSSLNATPISVTLDTDLVNTTTPGGTGVYSPGAAANYGTNSLTINVTVNTEVIAGPEGTRELAKLIDRELYNLRRQGLATSLI